MEYSFKIQKNMKEKNSKQLRDSLSLIAEILKVLNVLIQLFK